MSLRSSFGFSAALMLPLLLTGPAIAQQQMAPPTSSALPPAAPPGAVVGPVPRTGTASALPHAGAANLSSADQSFIQKAAQGGIAEVQMGQMAQQKSNNDQVKQFAQRMIDDHTKNNEQLVSLASSLGVTPPTEPNAVQQKMAARLEGMSGSKFDRAYIRGQIHDHEVMLKLFQAEASDSQNAQLKAFAEQTIPTLQEHLSLAEQAQKAGA